MKDPIVPILISAIVALFTALTAVAVAYRSQSNKSARTMQDMMNKIMELGTRFAETAGGLKSAIDANTKATDRGAQVTDDLHKTILKTTKRIKDDD